MKPLNVEKQVSRGWKLYVSGYPIVMTPGGRYTWKGRVGYVEGLPVHVFATRAEATSNAFTIGRYILKLGDFVDTYTDHTKAPGKDAPKAPPAAIEAFCAEMLACHDERNRKWKGLGDTSLRIAGDYAAIGRIEYAISLVDVGYSDVERAHLKPEFARVDNAIRALCAALR
jgi:hypothetical protein